MTDNTKRETARYHVPLMEEDLTNFEVFFAKKPPKPEFDQVSMSNCQFTKKCRRERETCVK